MATKFCLPILISPSYQSPKNNLDPLYLDLNQPLFDLNATNNEVILLPVEGAIKNIPIVVILEGDEKRLEEPTVNKPQQQIKI